MATYRHSYVFELDCLPPVRAWTGFGDLDIDGETYQGLGDVVSLPDLKQLINGVAERLEVTISGVTAAGVRIFDEDRQTIPLADARIGRVEFDDEWQLVGGISYLWHGQADTVSIGSAQDDGGRKRTVRIGMGSADTRRSNPQLAFFTDADQRRRSPDDTFFRHVGQITVGITREFGPK